MEVWTDALGHREMQVVGSQGVKARGGSGGFRLGGPPGSETCLPSTWLSSNTSIRPCILTVRLSICFDRITPILSTF